MPDAYPADIGGVDRSRLAALYRCPRQRCPNLNCLRGRMPQWGMVDQIHRCIRLDSDCADISATHTDRGSNFG
jgi:hypothetical protein